MYEKQIQHYPRCQYKNNNFIVFMNNNVKKYQVPPIGLDIKEKELQLAVIEVLVTNWEHEKQFKNIWGNHQPKDQEIPFQSIIDRDRDDEDQMRFASSCQRVSLPIEKEEDYHIKYTNISGLKEFLSYEFARENLLYEGISGRDGLLKLQTILQTIIEHCDKQKQTKQIHKVLLLSFYYLQICLKLKEMKLYQRKQNKIQPKLIETIFVEDMVNWLDIAHRLFFEQLQHPGIAGEGAVTSRRRGSKNKLQKLNKQISSFDLQKRNDFKFILNLLQELQLSKMVNILEGVALEIQNMYSNSEKTDKELQQICKKIEFTIQLIQNSQYIEKKNWINRKMQRYKKNKNTQSSYHPNQQNIGPALFFTEEQIEKKPNSIEKFRDIEIVLEAINGILKGDQTTIRNYSGNNFYLYIKLNIIFNHKKKSINISKCKQTAVSYLQSMYKISISRQNDTHLKPCHDFLLTLISRSLYCENYQQQAFLRTHQAIQKCLFFFKGKQFYGYLITNLLFHFRAVEKQIFSLHQEYWLQASQGLLQSSISPYIEEKKQIQIKEVNAFSAMEQEFALGEEIDLKRNLNKIQLAIRPKISDKLLLCTISFFKNILAETQITKKFEFLQNLKLPKGQKQLQLPYLPNLDQFIQYLICENFESKPLVTKDEINWVRHISEYSFRVGAYHHFRQYIKTLINLTLHRSIFSQHNEDVPMNENILELMILEVTFEVAITSQMENFQQGNFSMHHHQMYWSSIPKYTIAYSQLVQQYFLTKSTLHTPFDYGILERVEKLTGQTSILRRINKKAADEMQHFFAVFVELQPLTKRGRYIKPQVNLMGEKYEGDTSKRQDQKTIQNLKHSQSRIQSMIQILLKDSLQGCGEVLRVCWEVLDDYHSTKKQIQKSNIYTAREQMAAIQISARLVYFLELLQFYIRQMQNSGFLNQQLMQFKKYFS